VRVTLRTVVVVMRAAAGATGEARMLMAQGFQVSGS
jgi:hypothetical protein